MNVTETIFALALASNFDPKTNFEKAYKQIQTLGETIFSDTYLIPCRDGVGEDYWNSACILKSNVDVEALIQILKTLEMESGRIRPSHKISLDVDLIAWGKNLNCMQFNPKKLPLALDVEIPLSDIWQDKQFNIHAVKFPKVMNF